MDETFDFVVVGSGAGSMCAALVLRAAGKSVLVLEKEPLVGGTTAASGGVMWIPNNRFMREAGVADSGEQALAYLDAVVGNDPARPGASVARRRAYVDHAPKMLDFLVEGGLAFRRIPSWPDYFDAPGASVAGRAVVSQLFDIKQLGPWRKKLRPGFLPLPANLDEAMELPNLKRDPGAKAILKTVLKRLLADLFTGRKRATAGQALAGQLLHFALQAGTEVRPDSTVAELLLDGGRVSGVRVARNGSEKRIGARLGVLLNAGGFARNQQMLDQYQPGIRAEWSSVPPGDTGEMIVEGARIGAALAQMNERLGMPSALPPGHDPLRMKAGMQNDMSKPHAIVVDQRGRRYARESCSHVEFTAHMLERNKTVPAVPSWMICDSQYVATYMLAGSRAGTKKPKAWLEQKFLRSADSVEALAAACGIDGEALKATVERFNDFVAAGRDGDFRRGEAPYERWVGDRLNRPSNTLGAIDRPPFYAVPFYPGDVGTFGGLVTDEHARVLRADGSVIEGLYATGTATASVMGAVEPGAGASIGPSMTFGFIAAQHALRN